MKNFSFWFLILILAPISLPIILIITLEDYFDARGKKYIIPYGIKVYLRDLDNQQKLEKSYLAKWLVYFHTF